MPTNILLLQGPVGPFFERFSTELSALGNRVYKVNFNAGDRYFYQRAGAVSYRGGINEWGRFLEDLISRLSIERIYVFGDCRIYHEIARDVAKQSRVRFFVFEEGYLRPDYITLEENGVNGHSEIAFPDNPAVVSLRPEAMSKYHYSCSFLRSGWYAIQYYIAASWGEHEFPFYRHHRPLNVLNEGSKWLISGWRKLKYLRSSRRFEQRVSGELAGRYFLVPLQVHADMQVLKHSRFRSVEEFISAVCESFSRSAPDDVDLVFKHHPLDRGYRHYGEYIHSLENRYGLTGRIHYVFDSHLPTLLKHALGTVTINSTVGLSSLHHGVPVKVMGDAIYDQPGLAFSGALDQFWRDPGKVDRRVYRQFRKYLLDTNQANGNFYERSVEAPNATGVLWSPYLSQQHCAGFRPPPGHSSKGPQLVKDSVA